MMPEWLDAVAAILLCGVAVIGLAILIGPNGGRGEYVPRKVDAAPPSPPREYRMPTGVVRPAAPPPPPPPTPIRVLVEHTYKHCPHCGGLL